MDKTIDEILDKFAAECVLYTYEVNSLPKHDQDAPRITAVEARTQIQNLITQSRIDLIVRTKDVSDENLREYLRAKEYDLHKELVDLQELQGGVKES